jgi:hypothetical protein
VAEVGERGRGLVGDSTMVELRVASRAGRGAIALVIVTGAGPRGVLYM